MKRCTEIMLFAFLSVSTPVFAGVFHLADSTLHDPFIVVHPPGYTGSGGVLEVNICVSSGSENAVPSIREAVEIWNNLSRTTGNCVACRLWEEGPSGTDAPFGMKSVVLHELGHCAIGLGHINWRSSMGETSFTNSKDANSIDDGADGIRGSKDDSPLPLPGSRLIHWFRIGTNDPFATSGTVIGGSSYTRRIIDLPSGHSWPASANRGVGLLLGHLDTQTVMYSGIDSAQRYIGLAADEVNTVQFGMSGVDFEAGQTADNYSIQLVFGYDCLDAEIEVRFRDFGPGDTGPGSCLADLDPLPTGGLNIHHTLVPFLTESRITVDLNINLTWDTVFFDGFESGSLARWSATGP